MEEQLFEDALQLLETTDISQRLTKDCPCIGALLILLSSAKDSIAAFTGLAMVPENAKKLSEIQPLLRELEKLQTRHKSQNIRVLASNLLRELASKSENPYSTVPRNARSRKLVVQYDPSLTREEIENRLKDIRGTISWTFVPERNRAVIWVTRQVNTATVVQALSAEESSEVKLVKNSNKTVSRMGSRHSNRSRRSTATTSIKPLPSYLEDDADLFKVDEKKGLPFAKGSLIGGEQTGTGVVSWLSGIFERKLYW